MTARQRRLTLALNTANDWSSDTSDGINLLSLGTTRTIHSEKHRAGCVAQIKRDILWNCTYMPQDDDDVNQPSRDIPKLADLLLLVSKAKVGAAWLTDAQYCAFTEVLFQRNIH